MTLAISLSAQAAEMLRAKAAAAGVDVATYAARELERSLAPARSLSEISGPAFDEFQKSGMTDDQLGDLLEDAKHAMRAERRATRRT
jgi:hypothetical protein